MSLVTIFTIFAVVGLLSGAPASNEDEDEKVVITKNVYVKEFVQYTGEHDIVNIIVPLNSLNFEEDSSESKEDDSNVILFFVEADTDSEGKRVDKGLYVLSNGVAKKLLEHGRDAAASSDDSKSVYLGAKDGLYIYNQTTNSADKFGSITDSIIGLAKEKEGDILYILTEDRNLYKVSVSDGKKEKVEDVEDADQIVLDFSGNLYFYSDDKQAYVRNSDGVSQIQGLPENPSSVYLIKPPVILEDAVPFVVDNTVYILYANATSEPAGFEFKPKAKPTAYAPEATLLQYYAYDKKIYEYNLLLLILASGLEDFDDFISKKSTQISELASNNKGRVLSKKN